LAQETAKSLLLTDDFQARVAAESVGIQVVPTIRVLSTAGALSLVDFDDAVRRLRQTNFRVSQKVIDRIASSRL
jgi:predicted nucleic acid-binding protein